MTNVIYKYPIIILNEQEIELPKGARIMTVQIQHGEPVLWAIVDLEIQEKELRIIKTYTTGQSIPDLVPFSHKYIATYQLNDFVGHVFEKLNLNK